jgi:hypothetical protein
MIADIARFIRAMLPEINATIAVALISWSATRDPNIGFAANIEITAKRQILL